MWFLRAIVHTDGAMLATGLKLRRLIISSEGEGLAPDESPVLDFVCIGERDLQKTIVVTILLDLSHISFCNRPLGCTIQSPPLPPMKCVGVEGGEDHNSEKFVHSTPPSRRAQYLPRQDMQPSAKPSALQISSRRSELSVPTRRPSKSFGTVTRLCRFTAHGPLSPSASLNCTSEATSRMVEVIGATVTAARYGMTLFLVKTTTGLRLSGRAKGQRRMSPRVIAPATLPPAPSAQPLQGPGAALDRHGARVLPAP
jgi:hypothetical protein